MVATGHLFDFLLASLLAEKLVTIAALLVKTSACYNAVSLLT